MLIELRNWWQIAFNDTGTPRPDSISIVPEGMALLEAEQLARKREPGNGFLQRTVTEQLDQALATFNNQYGA